MRALITFTFVLALAWSGWWFVGTSAQKTAIETWMDQRRDAGWIAEVDDFKITGFPNRFDNIFTDLTLSNPYAGWTWEAPEFQLLALSYKPNHIIAVWPQTQSYSTIAGITTITSELFRGSLIFKPDTSLALDRMQLEIDELALSGETNANITADEASIAFFSHNAPDLPPNSYDLYIKALEFAPPALWHNSLEQSEELPATIPEVILDASLTYDAPWDRFAVERANPRLTELNIRALRFVWGELELGGSGPLTVDADGYLNGEVTLKARNWRDLLDVIIAAQLLHPDFAKSLDRGVTFVATLAGNPKDMEITLRFAQRLSYVGAIPIGPAPRVH